MLLVAALLAAPAYANDRPEVQAQLAAQFLPDTVAQHASVRALGDGDAYLGAEARWVPGSHWTGRVGAGFDVLGGGNWDFKLGLFLGGAGGFEHGRVQPVIAAGPQMGTEIAFGAAMGRLGFQYRWLAGLGGDELDELLTENEATLSFRVADPVTVFGQYVRLNPGQDVKESGLGLGARVTF